GRPLGVDAGDYLDAQLRLAQPGLAVPDQPDPSLVVGQGVVQAGRAVLQGAHQALQLGQGVLEGQGVGDGFAHDRSAPSGSGGVPSPWVDSTRLMIRPACTWVTSQSPGRTCSGPRTTAPSSN